MKVELGQFYLGSHDTVFIFTKRTEKGVSGTAWQNKLAHNVRISEDKKGEINYTFIPIDSAIAQMILATQHKPIDTGVA